MSSSLSSITVGGKRSSNTMSQGETSAPSYIDSHLPLHSSSQPQVPATSSIEFDSTPCNPPWLTASKGDIKKFAQTLFSNSSPISYRAMPATVESSESDKTSFVEKSFIHKIIFPVSYYLEVAKLWALSKRSELECRFTVAQSDPKTKNIEDFQQEFRDKKQRPISHSGLAKPSHLLLSHNELHNMFSDKSTAEEDLLRSVNRFMECCRLKDKSLSNSKESDLMHHGVGSETRRYLSQIMSLMNESFAKKLVKEHSKSNNPDYLIPRKRTPKCDFQPDVALSTSRVKVITMSPEEQKHADNKEQFVIIHIPKRKKSDPNSTTPYHNSKFIQDADNDSSLKLQDIESSNTEEMEVDENSTDIVERISPSPPHPNTERCWSPPPSSSFSCFYCQHTFPDQHTRARHMLIHLTSKIQVDT